MTPRQLLDALADPATLGRRPFWRLGGRQRSAVELGLIDSDAETAYGELEDQPGVLPNRRREWTVFVPDSGSIWPGWYRPWTAPRQRLESVVYFPIREWSIADLDKAAGGGAPRGVLSEVRTDRGVQWAYPSPGRAPARSDAIHRRISEARGWAGQRVSGRRGNLRTLREGPCVGATTVGAWTLALVADCWREAAYAEVLNLTRTAWSVDPGAWAQAQYSLSLSLLIGQPRRTQGCPRILGRLDQMAESTLLTL